MDWSCLRCCGGDKVLLWGIFWKGVTDRFKERYHLSGGMSVETKLFLHESNDILKLLNVFRVHIDDVTQRIDFTDQMDHHFTNALGFMRDWLSLTGIIVGECFSGFVERSDGLVQSSFGESKLFLTVLNGSLEGLILSTGHKEILLRSIGFQMICRFLEKTDLQSFFLTGD